MKTSTVIFALTFAVFTAPAFAGHSRTDEQGRKHGHWTEFPGDGVISIEGEYINGKKHCQRVVLFVGGVAGESPFASAISASSKLLLKGCGGSRHRLESLRSHWHYLADRMRNMQAAGYGDPRPLYREMNKVETQIYAENGQLAVRELLRGNQHRAAAILADEAGVPKVKLIHSPEPGKWRVDYGDGIIVDKTPQELANEIISITAVPGGSRCRVESASGPKQPDNMLGHWVFRFAKEYC